MLNVIHRFMNPTYSWVHKYLNNDTTLVAVSLYTKIDLKSHSQDVIEVQVLNFNSRGSIKV